jgi:hypothetical protein
VLHDANAAGGDDDMFSMDLSAEYMQSCLAPVGAVPSLVLASGADEAVPDPSTIPTTAQRIAKAINAGELTPWTLLESGCRTPG